LTDCADYFKDFDNWNRLTSDLPQRFNAMRARSFDHDLEAMATIAEI